jgi:xanthine dehydrogenase accessory factor
MIVDDALRELVSGSGPVALVTLARASGSTPRDSGSRMLVRPDGSIVGTVGGGKPEARARERALELLRMVGAERREARCATLHIEMTGSSATGVDLICGGTADMWLELVEDRSLYAAALEAVDRGEAVVLAASAGEGCLALLSPGGEVLARASGARAAFDRAAATSAASSGLCALGESDGLLYAPVEPPERLLILGGGHVGLALARIAQGLSFRPTVADPRPEYSEPSRFPSGVECLRAGFAEAIGAFPAGPSVYAVVVSPGHLGDLECARALMAREYRYVGVIGSRRKTRMIIDALISEGFDRGKAEALRMPIGLDIGAQTPGEIAISIAAEMIAVRRGSASLKNIDLDRLQRRAT